MSSLGAVAARSPVATTTPEERGLERDQIRLLVSDRDGHRHGRFYDLPDYLRDGDLLVVNRSATIPAALPARVDTRSFRLHLSTRYGTRLWLAEARWSATRPGPVSLAAGEVIEAGGVEAVALGTFPGIPRLRFFEFVGSWEEALSRQGTPISYGYLAHRPPLAAYQTIFGDRPGSAEMPSAGRPFTERTLAALERRGVDLVKLTLHTGVSSLETGDIEGEELYPEPFEVDGEAVQRLNEATSEGRRVVAVGTTTVRALVSAWDGSRFQPAHGMTRVYIRPGRPMPPLSGVLTGFHEPDGTHLSLLEAVTSHHLVSESYRAASRAGYLWHEFGDVHLLLTGRT